MSVLFVGVDVEMDVSSLWKWNLLTNTQDQVFDSVSNNKVIAYKSMFFYELQLRLPAFIWWVYMWEVDVYICMEYVF